MATINPNDLSPTGRAALEYVEQGLAVIPIKAGEKKPAISKWTSEYFTTPAQVAGWWGKNPHQGVGIVTGAASSGVFALDLDRHKEGADGVELAERWQGEHGAFPETWACITGSGGTHLYYRGDVALANSANEFLGVDVRATGGFVVAPPSAHPDTGAAYEWSVSPDDMEVAEANDSVLAFIEFAREDKEGRKAEKRGKAEKKGDHDPDGGEAYKLPDVIEKGGRNEELFSYGRHLLGIGNSHDEVAALVRVANQARCKPPLPAGEVEKTIESINSKKPGRGPVSIFKVDSRRSKIRDEYCGRTVGFLENTPELNEHLKFNTLKSTLYVLGPCIPNTEFKAPHQLTEGESMNIFSRLQHNYGIRNKSTYQDALAAFGGMTRHQYNPLDELLDQLPKVEFVDPAEAGSADARIRISNDGGKTWGEEQPAVSGHLFGEYLGVERDTYTVQVELLMLRQLVARAMHPGCKADHMIVFVGKQGCGKSTFVSLLAPSPDYFLEGFSNFDTEDLKRLAGALVVEIPELDGFGKRDKNRIKAVITQTTDLYRDSYAKRPAAHPRTATFYGTTNDASFLNDETGARRFLVVESTKDEQDADPRLFDGTAAAAIRQAWAENLALLHLWGEAKFLQSLVLPPEALAQGAKVREKYAEEDAEANDVRDHLAQLVAVWRANGGNRPRVNVKYVYAEALNVGEERFHTMVTTWQKNHVAAILDTTPGWERMEGKARVTSPTGYGTINYGTARTWEYVGE